MPAFPADPAQGQFDSLIKSSPFGSSASTGAPGGNGAAPLEFRSVLMDKGEYFFSLHETATRSSQWVGLKESGQPYVVDSYDADKGSIQVKYHGQTLALSLKLAQVIVQAPPPMPTPGPANTPAIIANAPSGDEATRLAQVAEEIRRRRALRAPQGPVPQPNATTNPPRPAATRP